jgi:hypothetical protein
VVVLVAAQPDGSVGIIQVDYSTNQVRLLESTADTVGPMAGPELTTKSNRRARRIVNSAHRQASCPHRQRK